MLEAFYNISTQNVVFFIFKDSLKYAQIALSGPKYMIRNNEGHSTT